MRGWEFPPFISGGLGTACHGLTQALTRLGTRILFVLPTAQSVEHAGCLAAPGPALETSGRRMVQFVAVPCAVRSPYASSSWGFSTAIGSASSCAKMATESGEPMLRIMGTGAAGGYDGNLILRITEYADRCVKMTLFEDFDHARWMGQKGREAVDDRFTWDRIVQDTQAVYAEAVGPHLAYIAAARQAPAVSASDAAPAMRAAARLLMDPRQSGAQDALAACERIFRESPCVSRSDTGGASLEGDWQVVLAALERCCRAIQLADHGQIRASIRLAIPSEGPFQGAPDAARDERPAGAFAGRFVPELRSRRHRVVRPLATIPAALPEPMNSSAGEDADGGR